MGSATSTAAPRVNTFPNFCLIDVPNQLLRLAANQMSMGWNLAARRAPPPPPLSTTPSVHLPGCLQPEGFFQCSQFPIVCSFGDVLTKFLPQRHRIGWRITSPPLIPVDPFRFIAPLKTEPLSYETRNLTAIATAIKPPPPIDFHKWRIFPSESRTRPVICRQISWRCSRNDRNLITVAASV